MNIQFTPKEIFVLLVISLMSFLANVPENMGIDFVDRKLLLAALIAVVVVAMFRYLQMLLLMIISILAIGANLPNEMAQALGVSQPAMMISLGLLIAVTLLNRVLNLLPTDAEALKQDVADARKTLLAAIAKGDIGTLRELLEQNVDVNFTMSGTTPLHLATEKGYSNIVQLLLDHGADFLMVNAEGQTPLDVALAKKKFIRTTEILFSATMSGEQSQPN